MKNDFAVFRAIGKWKIRARYRIESFIYKYGKIKEMIGKNKVTRFYALTAKSVKHF